MWNASDEQCHGAAVAPHMYTPHMYTPTSVICFRSASLLCSSNHMTSDPRWSHFDDVHKYGIHLPLQDLLEQVIRCYEIRLVIHNSQTRLKNYCNFKAALISAHWKCSLQHTNVVWLSGTIIDSDFNTLEKLTTIHKCCGLVQQVSTLLSSIVKYH